MRNSIGSKPIKVDWGNIRHDPELEKLLSPSKPMGAEFVRNVEKAMFEYMLLLHIDKLYIWDGYAVEGSTARWDFHYGAKRPENKACDCAAGRGDGTPFRFQGGARNSTRAQHF